MVGIVARVGETPTPRIARGTGCARRTGRGIPRRPNRRRFRSTRRCRLQSVSHRPIRSVRTPTRDRHRRPPIAASVLPIDDPIGLESPERRRGVRADPTAHHDRSPVFDPSPYGGHPRRARHSTDATLPVIRISSVRAGWTGTRRSVRAVQRDSSPYDTLSVARHREPAGAVVAPIPYVGGRLTTLRGFSAVDDRLEKRRFAVGDLSYSRPTVCRYLRRFELRTLVTVRIESYEDMRILLPAFVCCSRIN